jgi:4-hydroxy-tetrahydrodipicolinate reductase
MREYAMTNFMSLSIGIIGASGKMGKALYLTAVKDPEVTISGACCSPDSHHLGKDLGVLHKNEPCDIFLHGKLEEIIDKVDVLIDFSVPDVTIHHIQIALHHQKPLVIGTTGHPVETKIVMETASHHIPLLFSPNFSFGMALCQEACSFFSRHLKGSAYIDIIETHHTQKKDAPSGTALALAKSLDFGHICPGTLVEHPRSKETIAIHSIRTGEVVGQHQVIFECQGESIEIKHEAFSREAFAKGALQAAKFLSHCSPGLYTMKDLLHEQWKELLYVH